MKRATGWMVGFAAAGLMVAGCEPKATDPVAENDSVVALADYEIGAPVTHGNLTIFPVTSKQARTEDRFITLDEGLKAGTVEVFEIGSADGEGVPSDAVPNASPDIDGVDNYEDAAPQAPAIEASDGCEETFEEEVEEPNDPQIDEPLQQIDNDVDVDIEFQQGNFQGGGREVNRLMVVNRSDKPLYLMPGEIIIGGSQDRTIGQELVIAPTGKPVPIDVFCVEQQRWHDREVEQTVAELNVASRGALGGSIAVEGEADVDQAAQGIAKGKFIASVGNLNKSARLELQQSGEQGKVWEKVALQNSASMVAAEDATFSANYSDADFVKQLEPYVQKLQQPIAERRNIVGVIVAVGGKVESMDMFESTPLFKKLWPKLLKSYALDAATQRATGEAETEATDTATIADARTFFEKAARGEVTKENTTGELAVVARESEGVICFTSRRIDATAAAAAMTAEGLPAEADASIETGGVHVSAFAN